MRVIGSFLDFQEAKAAGCRTSAEAERYVEQKRRREAEENARRVKESVEAGPGGKVLVRAGHHRDLGTKDSSSTTAGNLISNSLDEWDITGFPGAELLSETVSFLISLFLVLFHLSHQVVFFSLANWNASLFH